MRTLQDHPFLAEQNLQDVDIVGWVEQAMVYKDQQEQQRAKMLAQIHLSA